MDSTADRYVRLCRAYIHLADKFHKLDVDYMSLKGTIVPLLKRLKAHQAVVEQLQQEKQALTAELQSTLTQVEQLKSLESLLHPEIQAVLLEAEEQVSLVDATLQEMEEDSDPDLDEADKVLLREYYQNPDQFSLLFAPVELEKASDPVQLYGESVKLAS